MAVPALRSSLFLVLAVSSFASAATPPPTPALVEKGKAAFKTNCVTCHGEKGDGNGPAGGYMNPKPRDFSQGIFKAGSKPAELFKTITQGLKGTSMPGFGQLPEEDRWAVTYYVRSFIKDQKK